MAQGIVYIHTDSNSVSYIGKSWKGIKRFVGNGRWFTRYHGGKLSPAMRAIRFETSILCSIETDDPKGDDPLLTMLEIMAIEFFETKYPNGYNSTRGGDVSGFMGWRHTDEWRRQRREQGRVENLPKERIEKMKRAQIGRLRDARGHYAKMPEPAIQIVAT